VCCCVSLCPSHGQCIPPLSQVKQSPSVRQCPVVETTVTCCLHKTQVVDASCMWSLTVQGITVVSVITSETNCQTESERRSKPIGDWPFQSKGLNISPQVINGWSDSGRNKRVLFIATIPPAEVCGHRSWGASSPLHDSFFFLISAGPALLSGAERFKSAAHSEFQSTTRSLPAKAKCK